MVGDNFSKFHIYWVIYDRIKISGNIPVDFTTTRISSFTFLCKGFSGEMHKK